MPRLEDREVRLAVIRDGDEYRNRLRLLVPFSVEKPAIPLAVPVMRTWSNPFGPLGTPLLDRDDPEGVHRRFLRNAGAAASQAAEGLGAAGHAPRRCGGAHAERCRRHVRAAPRHHRPGSSGRSSKADLEGEDYLKASLGNRHYREFRRLGRRLAEQGVVEHRVARSQDDIRHALEQFLTLEASGWKGRRRTAMVIDRYRAAFAREAVHRLAERDLCRIHSLTLDGRAIASLVVFIEAGIAYTWKIAYDEALSAFSPGVQLMMEVTGQHLDDPNIVMTDFLRHTRSSDARAHVERAKADGNHGHRADARGRPRHPPGGVATASLSPDAQAGGQSCATGCAACSSGAERLGAPCVRMDAQRTLQLIQAAHRACRKSIPIFGPMRWPRAWPARGKCGG